MWKCLPRKVWRATPVLGYAGKRCVTSAIRSATDCSLRRRSQVVRQRFAKPPFTSSNLVGASILPLVVVGMFPIADPGARVGAATSAPVSMTARAQVSMNANEAAAVVRDGERVRAAQPALCEMVRRPGRRMPTGPLLYLL